LHQLLSSKNKATTSNLQNQPSSNKSQVAAAHQLQKLNCIIQHETALNRAVTITSWRQQLLSGISRPVTTKLQQLPKCNKYPAETTNQQLQLDRGNKQQRSSCNNYPVVTSNEKKTSGNNNVRSTKKLAQPQD
jgi:hypothetical protein